MAKRVYVQCQCCDKEHGYDQFRTVGIRGTGRSKGSTRSVQSDRITDRFAKRIRERDGRCVYCGATGRLEAAHVFSRRFKTLYRGLAKHTGWNCCLRHDERNCHALCHKHHEYLDSHIAEKEAFFTEYLTPGVYTALEVLKGELRGRVPRERVK